jgi:hypothetical protein
MHRQRRDAGVSRVSSNASCLLYPEKEIKLQREHNVWRKERTNGYDEPTAIGRTPSFTNFSWETF